MEKREAKTIYPSHSQIVAHDFRRRQAVLLMPFTPPTH